MNKHLLWADILRIFAIYLVLIIHSATLPNTPFLSALSAMIVIAIASTCVPLFFMLSGALLLPKNEGTFLFFRKRFFRIFIPYVFWVFIFIVCLCIYHMPHNPADLLKTIATGFRGFWFLPILFVLYILTPALRSYVKQEKKGHMIIPLLVWYFLIALLPYMRNTAAFPLLFRDDILSQVVYFSGYFLLGYFIATTKYCRTKQFSSILIVIGLLWSIGGTLLLYTKDTTIHALYFSYISPSTVLLSAGIFSLCINCDTTFNKVPKKIKNIFIQISKLIFGVYLLQTIIVQIFDRIRFHIPHTFLPVIIDLPLVAFIFFLCVLCIIFLLSKIPGIKHLIA